MALLDRDGPGRDDRGRKGRRIDQASLLDGFDRRLLVVALALAVLTLLALLDLRRPVPGSERPVEFRLPPLERTLATAPVRPSRAIPDDDLLGHD